MMKRRTINQNVWAWAVSLGAITMMMVYGCQSGGGNEDPQSATQTQIGGQDSVATNHLECQKDWECKNPSKPVCSENTCVPCDAHHFCNKGICDYPTGQCVECMRDTDCVVVDEQQESLVAGDALWGHLDGKAAQAQKGVCESHVCVACNDINCFGTCKKGKCVDEVEYVCNGNNCGIPSPVNIEDIDPQTRQIANSIVMFHVDVADIATKEVAPFVDKYNVHARVHGLYATVTTEFTIVNTNSRVMEGELEFPLPDDAVVSGYAIDVGGSMTPAQVVEKQQARIAYESEMRLGVDPGIVEQIKGNAYRTRIYPIPSHGLRRVRVEYTTPLVIAPNGDAALALPMPQTTLSRRDISIDVVMQDGVAPALGGLGDKRFQTAESVWHVESHESQVTPSDNILVAMPKLPDVIVSSENFRNEKFFIASVKTDGPQQVKLGDKWRIVWDASGSRSSDDIKKARQFLDELPEKGQYELHVFRNRLEPVQNISGRAKLLEVIDALAYDGGTDFGSLSKIASKKFAGTTLFFTDGVDTMQGSLPEFGASSVAVMTGTARDVSSMRKICGGRTINLDVVNGKDAMAQIVQAPVVVSSVTGNVSDVEGIGITRGGRVTVVGRVQNGDKAVLSLTNGKKINVTIPQNDTEGKTIATAWAAHRVDGLSPNASDHKEELLALGRRFSIVSPVSSMIVFENLNQWIKYNIEPPESLEDLHAQWLEKRPSKARLEEERAERETEWLEDVTAEWELRMRWWKQPKHKAKFVKRVIRNWDDDWWEDYWDGEMEYELVDDVCTYVPWDDDDDWDDDWDDDDWGKGVRRVNAPQAAGARMPTADRPPASPSSRPEPSKMMMLDGAGSNYVLSAEPEGSSGGGASMGGFGGGGLGEARSTEVHVSISNGSLGSKRSTYHEMAEHDEDGNVDGSISILEWDPDMPYLQAILDAKKIYKKSDSAYKEYLNQRIKYGSSPAFYFDCANLFFKEKQKDLALRILSNLSELKIDDVSLLRTYAWRLREAGEYDEAILILRKVTQLRPDEVVSWRDLALTLTVRGKEKKSVSDIQEALEIYHKIIMTPWDYHNEDQYWASEKTEDALYVAVMALEEWNELAEWAKRQGLSGKIKLPDLPDKFRKNLDMDVRIIMNWDTDNTDIDLHVFEPNGYEVFYRNPCSPTGGMVSHDITMGYGPEEFIHRYAPRGKYLVATHYYSSSQQKLVGPATITVTFYTNWGRSNQKSETVTLRLEEEQDKVKVGTFTLK